MNIYIPRLSIALIAATVCLSGCFITYESKSTGDFDFTERFNNAAKEIVERSNQAAEATVKGHRATIDPKTEQFVQRHFVKAKELVDDQMDAVKHALKGNSFFFNEYAQRRVTLLDFTMTLQPSLDIVDSTSSNATAFPNGKIIFNKPLAEAFDPNKTDFDEVLLGIMIHELMHVRDGHALGQWATADGRKAWAKDKLLGGLSSITAVLPVITIKYDKQYPVTFGASKQLPALSEYAADLGAVSLLDKAGYNSGRYIAFLSEMSANTASPPTPESKLLEERVECLSIFSKSRFDQQLQAIVVGSGKAGDSLVMPLDFRNPYKAASLLDSPEELAKAFPGKSGLSDADRRRMVLASIRKSFYAGCAIRYSFSDVALKDGVLITPTFDVFMFVQHL